MNFDDKTISSEIVFNSSLLNIEQRELENENGLRYKREIIHRVDAAAVVAIENDEIILVKQLRPAVDKPLIELPAGIIENNDPKETAFNELIEETGHKATSLKLLTKVYSSAGYCDELVYIYLADGLTKVEAQPEEEEFIEIIKMPLKEALTAIKNGEIEDSKTIIGILLAADK